MRSRFLIVLVTLAGTVAQAQPTETPSEEAETETNAQADIDRARELFLQGVEQFEASDLDAAIASFSEAMSLHDAPTIRYNLASAHADKRNFVIAYQHVVALQERDDLEADLRRDVNRLERRIRGRVGRIDLRSSAEIDEVRLDGATAEPGLLIVEPGSHVLEGFRNGSVAVRREVEVARRERVTVDLAVVTVTEVVETPTPTPTNRAPLRRGLGIAAAVVAVAVVVIAVVATRGPDPVNGNLEPGVLRW